MTSLFDEIQRLGVKHDLKKQCTSMLMDLLDCPTEWCVQKFFGSFLYGLLPGDDSDSTTTDTMIDTDSWTTQQYHDAQRNAVYACSTAYQTLQTPIERLYPNTMFQNFEPCREKYELWKSMNET